MTRFYNPICDRTRSVEKQANCVSYKQTIKQTYFNQTEKSDFILQFFFQKILRNFILVF